MRVADTLKIKGGKDAVNWLAGSNYNNLLSSNLAAPTKSLKFNYFGLFLCLNIGFLYHKNLFNPDYALGCIICP